MVLIDLKAEAARVLSDIELLLLLNFLFIGEFSFTDALAKHFTGFGSVCEDVGAIDLLYNAKGLVFLTVVSPDLDFCEVLKGILSIISQTVSSLYYFVFLDYLNTVLYLWKSNIIALREIPSAPFPHPFPFYGLSLSLHFLHCP